MTSTFNYLFLLVTVLFGRLTVTLGKVHNVIQIFLNVIFNLPCIGV